MRTFGSHNRIVSLICENEECKANFSARSRRPKLCPECKVKERRKQQREWYERRKEKQNEAI